MALLLFILLGTSAQAADLALVYSGAGTCAKGCAEEAALMAVRAGFEVKLVGGEPLAPELWARAKVWIQPGGRVEAQAQAMSEDLKKQIKGFVKRGGGFVGFCAGAFFAAESFGWRLKDGSVFERAGLGLLPFKGRLFAPKRSRAEVLPIFDRGRERYVYWELGSYYQRREIPAQAELLSSYDREGEHVAALRAEFGEGRVSVSGYHPEAPNFWRQMFSLKDPDGLDFHEAEEMIRWAADR